MTTDALSIDPDRLRADFDQLAEIGATLGGGISRLALSNEDLEARAWFANRIEEAGLFVRDDDAGNLSGVLFASDVNAKTLLIGSHLDSVPNGGKYDGSIGVLAALECLRVIQESGQQFPVHLEAISFTDEEGCWQSFFGSKGLTGKLTPFGATDQDKDHAAFRAALLRAGIRPTDAHKAARDPRTVAGYLELHIEQGSRLYKQHADIGIVTAIVGRTTFHVTFFGEARHSGTTLPDERRDALLGAAGFIALAHCQIPEYDPDAIFNCGNIQVEPGAFNIIPEKASLVVECRHPDEQMLARVESQLIRLAQECALQQRLSVNIRRVVHMPAAPMSSAVITAIENACRVVGVDDTLSLISYAGHDAQMLSSFTPTGLIFIPSVNGISHNPLEHSEWSQVVKGANVLLHTLLQLAQQHT